MTTTPPSPPMAPLSDHAADDLTRALIQGNRVQRPSAFGHMPPGRDVHLTDMVPDGQVYMTNAHVFIGTGYDPTDLALARAEASWIVRDAFSRLLAPGCQHTDVLTWLGEEVGPRPGPGKGAALLAKLRRAPAF